MKIPENVIFLNLPAFKHIKHSELPATAQNPGTLYYVMDENGVPMGIALSHEDLSIKFYSIMQAIDAEGISFDGSAHGIEADDVQAALDYLISCIPPKNNLTAVRNPKQEDAEGFTPGSMWFNHDTGILWVCRDISESKAEWTPAANGYGS